MLLCCIHAADFKACAAEHVDEEASISAKADVWALAATLLECWTGGPPHGKLTSKQLWSRLMKGTAPSLDCTARPLPERLAAALRCCFATAPEERMSAQALCTTLCKARCELLPSSGGAQHVQHTGDQPAGQQQVCAATQVWHEP